MFKVNTEDSVKSNLYICKEYHIQPSEILRMPYYQYEIILEEIKVIQKQQEEQNNQQQKDYSNMRNQYNPSNIMKGMNNSMNNISMPKISIPKF